MYGGNVGIPFVLDPKEGLSPRVRGKLWPDCPLPDSRGSIPACTGETSASRRSSFTVEVYPRVYGGNPAGCPCLIACRGLSPRVRGKRRRTWPSATHARSIPACTGETRWRRPCSYWLEVYPRVYGGNGFLICNLFLQVGLSPRVRGKLRPA